MAMEAHQDPTDLRGRLVFWRRTAVILIGVGLLAAAGILVSVFRLYLTPARSDIAVPWVGECRVADDGGRVYVTVDLTAISDGWLRETSATRASQGTVEAAVLLDDRLGLGGRSDDELDGLIEGARADGRGRFGVDGFDTGT
ncbi:MAG: hypothetical protein J7484_14155, partial [Microbacterium sp.]|nr:hypothetical protein [Microbacterium sp.]